jgi:hypothetical protein
VQRTNDQKEQESDEQLEGLVRPVGRPFVNITMPHSLHGGCVCKEGICGGVRATMNSKNKLTRRKTAKAAHSRSLENSYFGTDVSLGALDT